MLCICRQWPSVGLLLDWVRSALGDLTTYEHQPVLYSHRSTWRSIHGNRLSCMNTEQMIILNESWRRAVAYLGGGPRCDAPPPWPDHENFLRRLYMKRCVFAVFQQELQNSTMFDGLFSYRHYAIKIAMWDCIWYDDVIFCVFEFQKKWANLRLPLNVQKQKVFQLQGGFAPDPPTRGFAPGPRWGLRPQTPVVGSRSRHAPFCQILSTPLTPGLTLWTVCYRRVKKKY